MVNESKEAEAAKLSANSLLDRAGRWLVRPDHCVSCKLAGDGREIVVVISSVTAGVKFDCVFQYTDHWQSLDMALVVRLLWELIQDVRRNYAHTA